MRIWRICRSRWAASAWDGEGARMLGGRWNHPGDRMVYTAASLALAALETLVHVDPGQLPNDLVAVPGDIPDTWPVTRWTTADLPDDWRRYPAPAALRELGSAWIRAGTTPALELPSAVISEERCVLLNPLHPRMAELRPGEPRPFSFDHRLLGR